MFQPRKSSDRVILNNLVYICHYEHKKSNCFLISLRNIMTFKTTILEIEKIEIFDGKIISNSGTVKWLSE